MLHIPERRKAPTCLFSGEERAAYSSGILFMSPCSHEHFHTHVLQPIAADTARKCHRIMVKEIILLFPSVQLNEPL